MSAFDSALAAGESEFVARRIYLTLERGRDICLRNLFRKVFLAGGFESKTEGVGTPGESTEPQIRRTRVPVSEFEAGMRLSLHNEKGEYQPGPGDVDMVDRDEVECFLANMIYKVRKIIPANLGRTRLTSTRQNLMKGYIARDRGIVVLSKTGAFPGTGV